MIISKSPWQVITPTILLTDHWFPTRLSYAKIASENLCRLRIAGECLKKSGRRSNEARRRFLARRVSAGTVVTGAMLSGTALLAQIAPHASTDSLTTQSRHSDLVDVHHHYATHGIYRGDPSEEPAQYCDSELEPGKEASGNAEDGYGDGDPIDFESRTVVW